MRDQFRRHPYVTGILALSLVLTVVFAIRLAAGAFYWSSHRNMEIQPWMTAGYIGKSWDLDPREIDRLAGLPAPQGHPLTLQDIARDRNQPVAQIIAQVETAIRTLRDQAQVGAP